LLERVILCFRANLGSWCICKYSHFNIKRSRFNIKRRNKPHFD